MENLPTSFQCFYCHHQLVVAHPSNEPVTGPCPVCANLITFEPPNAQQPVSEIPHAEIPHAEIPHAEIPHADLEPELEAPVLLDSPSRRFRRGKVGGSRRFSRRWFKSEIDTPVSPDGTPLLIKRRRKSAFVKPDRLADRLEQLSQSAH